MATETVYAVWDYHDGIRTGVADFKGEPHFFEQELSDQQQDYSPTFQLKPIAGVLLSKVVEQWQVFRDWETKFHCGLAAATTHPGLPGQSKRYAELDALIKAEFEESRPGRLRATGSFSGLPDQESAAKGIMREVQVEWQDVD